MSSDRAIHRSGERAARVEGGGPVGEPRALEEVVVRVAVEESAGGDQDQALFAVEEVEVAVEGMDRLLLVLGTTAAKRVYRKRGRRHDGRGVLAAHVEALAEGGVDGGRDALGDPLVVDVGDVVDAEPTAPVGAVEVLAAELEVLDRLAVPRHRQDVVPRMLEHRGALEHAAPFQMPAVRVRIGEGVQAAPDHRLWLVGLRDRHRLEPLGFLRHVDVAAEEVDEVRALEEHLRHPGVVVPPLRQVAVVAGLGLGGAHGVREVRVERLAREAIGRHGLLLRVYPLALDVLRPDEHRTR